MATKAVKVKAHKRLSGTGKIENVDAHVRKIEASNYEDVSGSLKNVLKKKQEYMSKIKGVYSKEDVEVVTAFKKEEQRLEGILKTIPQPKRTREDLLKQWLY